ncbi:hypothetical protein GGR58DRAFT_500061 [Xylaria digitata]|nr:hypothetical protein GGR58DRAFT_500061 [Xylaria digitata]
MKRKRRSGTWHVHKSKIFKCEITFLEWRSYAFCVVRYFNPNNDLTDTRLYIHPEPLRKLLDYVIRDCFENPIHPDDVQIIAPYHCLFHYRNDLELIGREWFKESEESKQDNAYLSLLLEFIQHTFKHEIEAYQACVNGGTGAIAYSSLRTLFPPGTIVYNGSSTQNRAYRVVGFRRNTYPACMVVSFIAFDGKRFCECRDEFYFAPYLGDRDVQQLECIPLDMHVKAVEIHRYLLERGRKYESCLGCHLNDYDGVAQLGSDAYFETIYIRGHIWDEGCFNNLPLKSNLKSVVKTLASVHVKKHEEVNGDMGCKREATVFLLQGPPGVGKVMTAKCVAEHLQRPLYAVSPYELGVSVRSFYDNLTVAMDLTLGWGAILLINEADAYLEDRPSNDRTHNAFVGAFGGISVDFTMLEAAAKKLNLLNKHINRLREN